eukprot:c3737_g1_i1 orf=228-926(-)
MGADNQGAMCAVRGKASNIVYKLHRWLNYTVIAASTIAIICMLILRVVPTGWGWGFMSFLFLTIASSIVGCISVSSMARGGMCYPLHMFLLIPSICIQGAVFLLLITRPDSVLHKLQSNRSEYDGKVLLKVDAALLLWVFCVQFVVLAMACIVHYCEPVNYYEDLESDVRTPHRGSRKLSRVQEESIADVQAEVAHDTTKDSKSESEASRLHKEMKEKYSQKKEESFDNVEI